MIDEYDVKESWEDEDEPTPVWEQHTQLVMENGTFYQKRNAYNYDSEGAFMQSGKTCANLLELSILFKRSGSLGRGGREDFCGQGFIKNSVQKCDAGIWDAYVCQVSCQGDQAGKSKIEESSLTLNV
ncbi:hypothetical protein DKX38_027402 [Salix brachista]|uniref:Uncharacterized protein n=1 Tax=Salix brachista TaxID=2182728 RepID=A0A5N5JFI8_9ROSI|nr:hypothetical protein DKX38_027402 [Salix brachista]